jgi:hypothetical protein
MTSTRQIIPWTPQAEPHFPPWGAGDPEIVMAIRAFKDGVANQTQQLTAWKYLMFVTGASEEFADMSYRPDEKGGRRATDFAEGKRFVGTMLRKLLRPEFTPKPQSTEAPPTVQKRMRARAAKRAA